jgi:crotonobetainyl-CoA:carnitine CoA-transferase CaiB-like acyl-CoA transferase
MKVMEGVRVVDVTTWAFVPSAGCVLAQWGADVIKVENPTAPDPMRLLGGTLEPGRPSPMFRHYNRGKRAMSIDLNNPEGLKILYKLVEEADVFLTSYLTETRRKLKIDIPDIKAINPRIIYAKGTGQGPNGPEAERGGYDLATWWCRGSLADSVMQVSGVDTPTSMIGHGDGMSGMTLAGGVSAALYQRERTGVASVVDASLLGTAIWFNGPAINSSKGVVRPIGPPAKPPRDLMPPGGTTYRTKDGRFLQLLFLGDSDRDWRDFFEHLGRGELANDARFANAMARMENRGALMTILDGLFAEATLEEWKARLATAKGVWAPVQTAAEIHDDPQTIANGFVKDVAYPDGPVPLVAPPILFDEDPGAPGRAPDFCEHTEEIMRDLGFGADSVAALRAAGVIA